MRHETIRVTGRRRIWLAAGNLIHPVYPVKRGFRLFVHLIGFFAAGCWSIAVYQRWNCSGVRILLISISKSIFSRISWVSMASISLPFGPDGLLRSGWVAQEVTILDTFPDDFASKLQVRLE